ncbi:hypothetical protein BACCOPRO_03486 [Phocaeicola coprophilus DSM 18228 = JCM 13818]|uniref:Uncharacterized protein n=1 Tax=Phocaeicola coprophilus DSM 18228 = JCM 13818 TaxID=547042 RepID=S0FBW9_9BACT|nr:hypothetical protein BACCOPRO_03486 [Phocaeicola coprophilus DSM 18228 = JCM 13818]
MELLFKQPCKDTTELCNLMQIFRLFYRVMKGRPLAEGCNTLGKRRRKGAGVSPAGRK